MSWHPRPSVAVLAVTLAVVVVATALAQQAPNLVSAVRAAIARQDFAAGERLVADQRTATGLTPIVIEAISWLGRGALAAGKIEQAVGYAQQAYDLTLGVLKQRRVDEDPRLATALGAAIEVLAQAGATRGGRSEAVAFLRQESTRWAGTSLTARIQKNLNLLSLEGTPAPAIDLSEFVGPAPPALSALKGKVVLMFFWAHWCGDCKAQAPVLARLLDRYRDQGLVLIAPTRRYGYVAAGREAPADEEKTYIDRMRQTAYAQLPAMPVPLASSNLDRYGVSTTPTLVLVDRDGIVRLYNPGRMTEDALEPHVRKALGGATTDARGAR